MMTELPMMGGYAPEPAEEPRRKPDPLVAQLEAGNLVEKLDDLKDESNASLYADIHERFEDAKASMEGWQKRYNKALKLAKMQPTENGMDIESKDFPFKGASLAMLPYIMEAMLDFQARAAPELVWTDELVRAKVNGEDSPQKAARVGRVEDFMNYQLTNDIPQWRRNQDKALLSLPCVGTFYKKTYYDFDLKKVCSDLRMGDKVIFDHKCDTFEDSKDKFEELNYSRNEVIAYIRGDQKWLIAEEDLEKDKDDFDFIEAHTWIDLDEDGIKEPYCAILYPETEKIVCLYPDYDEDTIYRNEKNKLIRITEKDCYTQYIFLPDPEGGPMGMGWGILLGPTFAAINTLVRQNIDAGTLALASANSGLIATSIGDGRGNRQQSGPIEVKMGQLTPIPSGGMSGPLSQNVMQLPFSGPNQTLLGLVQFLVESVRTLATAAYNVEAVQGEAASLYLARLQQGLKVPNMIVMRVYESAKAEFRKIALLNFKHHDSYYYNKVLDLPEQHIMAADFDPDDCDIDLVADPSQGSDVERVARAQNAYQMALEQAQAGIPGTIDMRGASLRLLEAQRVPEPEKLIVPPPEGPSPQEKLMMAQQQMQAEFMKREMDHKEAELELKKLKQAMDAAKTMTELGLKADIDEAAITEKYANALAKLVKDAGLSYQQARREVTRLEDDFIDAEGGTHARLPSSGGPLPPSQSGPSGAMAG